MERNERMKRMATEMSRTTAQNSVRISRARGVRQEEEKVSSYRFKTEVQTDNRRQKEPVDQDLLSRMRKHNENKIGRASCRERV